MELMTGQEQQSPQAQPRKASFWEDLVDVFVSPAELYRRHEKDSFVVPWLMVSVIGAVLYYAFISANRAMATAVMQAQMTKQGLTEVPANAQGFANVMVNLSGVMLPIIYVILFLLLGLAIWVVGLIAKGGPSFRQSMMIPAWAALVMPLQQVLVGVLVTLKVSSGAELSPIADASTGIMRFIGADAVSPIVQPLLGIVDIFWLWQAVLWFIALRTICRWEAGKAAAGAGVTWLLVALPGTLTAMIKVAAGGA